MGTELAERLRVRIEKQYARVMTVGALRSLATEEAGRQVSKVAFERLRSGLVGGGILHPLFLGEDEVVAYTVFRQPVDAEDVICGVNAHAVVSHLSAMAYHQLTDRMPTSCFYTLARGQGSFFTLSRDSFLREGVRPLPAWTPEKYENTAFVKASTRDKLEVLPLESRLVRYTTVGRTLFDMLHKPKMCGGIDHVLEVFDEHAELWVDDLVAEVDRWGSAIQKVRAGYILDERLGLSHPILAEWLKLAARGGSRKMDAAAPHNGKFSEKWCLALNQGGR